MARPPQAVDTAHRIPTPEATDAQLHPASFLLRSRAWLTDLALRLLALAACMVFLSKLSDLGAPDALLTGLFFLIMFAYLFLYFALFEYFWNGQTPGKRAFGIRVASINGARVTFGQALMRNIFRLIDQLPFAYGVGVACSLLNARFRRLGDLYALTEVVLDKSRAPFVWRLASWRVPPQDPGIELGADERDAILKFARRLGAIDPKRKGQMARDFMDKLPPGANPLGVDPVNYLLGVAKWLMRRSDPRGEDKNRRDALRFEKRRAQSRARRQKRLGR